MPSIQLLRASDSTGDATVATVTAARSAASSTFTVDSVAGWPSDFIATTGTPNVDTGLIEDNIQVFLGHLAGSNIVIDSMAPGYSNTGSPVGDIVVIKPTTRTQDELADILDVSLDDDGTLNDTAMGDIAASSDVQGTRRIPRISTAASTATLSPDIDDYNYYRLTAQDEALSIDNPTGTPNEGDGLLIQIQDDGTTRGLTWGSDYEADSIYGLALPTTTVVNKTHFLTFVWDSDRSKWVWVA